MRPRLLGLELELLLTRDGVPLLPAEWRDIVERAVARGCPRIDEAYTGFPLGAMCAKGQFVLDNNCAVVELVTLPHPSLEETLGNLRDLLDFFQSIAPGVTLNWTSQFGEPIEEEYWRRTPTSGLYAIVRKEQWKHWSMMNSMAFQPAIDLYPDEIAPVLRVLYLSSPAFICAFEGNKRWGAEHSPRLHLWRGMIPGGAARIGIPQREIASLADYVENLLELPAFILSDKYKKGHLTYFGSAAEAPSAAAAMFGEVTAQRIRGLTGSADPRQAEMQIETAPVRATLADFYGLSLPFWNARLVFETGDKRHAESPADIVKAIEAAPKRYVEIRHIGTPRDIEELERYYRSFIKLVENAVALDERISAVMRWDEVEAESRLAIRDGKPGEKSREVLAVLQDFGVLQGEYP
ncbi:MAG: hypothetical protein KGZ83_21350 [Sulfuricella sp.]|nr:hypothetical protein [Sulfuricella sp.]